MIVPFRCAACGSSHVAVDEKSEGYSVAKGLAGTFIFGAVGAVAGVGGKKKTYYHCAACGVTLSYPMGQTTKNMLNNYISDPDNNEMLLRTWKKSYPNIEWEEKSTQVSQISSNVPGSIDYTALAGLTNKITSIETFSQERVTGILKRRMKQYHEITKCTVVNEDDLRKAVGEDANDSSDKFWIGFEMALMELTRDYTIERGDSLGSYRFLSDDEKKAKAMREMNSKLSDEIYRESGAELSRELLNAMEINIWISYIELNAIFTEIVFQKGLCDDPEIVKIVLHKIIRSLFDAVDLTEQKDENENVFYARLDEDSKKQEITRRKEAEIAQDLEKSKKASVLIPQKESAAKKLFALLKRYFSNEADVYTLQKLTSIRNNDPMMKAAYGNKEFTELLVWCVHCKLLEYEGETYSLPGVHEANRIKEAENRIKEIEAQSLHLENAEKNLHSLTERQNALSADIVVQQKIYDENAKKIFGAGAKLKKEAKSKLLQLNAELATVSQRIRSTTQEIEQTKKKIQSLEAEKSSERTSQNEFNTQLKDEKLEAAKDILRILNERGMPMDTEMMQRNSAIVAKQTKIGMKLLMKQMTDDNLLLKIEAGNDNDFYIPV